MDTCPIHVIKAQLVKIIISHIQILNDHCVTKSTLVLNYFFKPHDRREIDHLI